MAALQSLTLPYTSGVARLGHTGPRALATRGRTPPVQVRNQIIGADSIIYLFYRIYFTVLNGLEIEQRSIANPQNY